MASREIKSKVLTPSNDTIVVSGSVKADFGQSNFGQSIFGHRVLPANFGQSIFGQSVFVCCVVVGFGVG